MSRRVIHTYSRRHQHREIKTEKDDIWGKIVGKSKEDYVFGSLSSGHDSSKTSDNSIELQEKRPNVRRNRKCQYNKENEDGGYLQKKVPTKKRGILFSLSDGTENTSSEFENSGNKPRPLRERNTSSKAPKPSAKVGRKKRVNKKRKTEPEKEEVQEERLEVQPKQIVHFSDFDDFSLCIEEDKGDNNEVLPEATTTHPNLTPSTRYATDTTNDPLLSSHLSPQMLTSTPQISKKPAEDLFRRLTKSNLKKLSCSGTGTPLMLTKYHASKSSTPSSDIVTSEPVSPAFSNISRRESMASELGNSNFNDTLGSVNISASVSHQITRRRTRHVGWCGTGGTSFNVFTPITMGGRQISHIPEQSDHELSLEMREEEGMGGSEEERNGEEKKEGHEEGDISNGEEGEVYHDEASAEEMEAAAEISQRLDALDISLTDEPSKNRKARPLPENGVGMKSLDVYYECHLGLEGRQSEYKTKSGDGSYAEICSTKAPEPAPMEVEKEKEYTENNEHKLESEVTPIRKCEIVLERLSESLVSHLTNSHKSVHMKSLKVSYYDPSKSLFSECDSIDYNHNPEGNCSSVYKTAEEGSIDHRAVKKIHLYDNETHEEDVSHESYEVVSDEEGDRGEAGDLGDIESHEEDLESHQSEDVTSEDESDTGGLGEARQLVGHLSIIEELNDTFKSFQSMTPIRSRSSGRILPPREKVLLQCEQENPITFSEFIPPTMMKKCVKIGEGVYGEVFRTDSRKASIALKIIPIEGDFPVNDEPQKTFAEVLPEILISQGLSDLCLEGPNSTPNFVQLNRCGIIEGTYPDHLRKEWDKFHEKKVSENDRPDKFPATQLFLVFDFEDSGTDLDSFTFKSLLQAQSVIHQVAMSLAVAELVLEFEHRDLHSGNVLIKETEEEVLEYHLDGDYREIKTHSVKAAVIDFTLSRIKKDGVIAFNNLALDPTIFEGKGDYQFDIYRRMRDENGNDWEPFVPFTNILWLHYLTDKLFNHKKYRGTTSKQHKSLSRQFRALLREMMDYNSAVHLVTSCPFFLE